MWYNREVRYCSYLLLLASALTAPGFARAANARVELELATGAQFPATSQQQWYTLLAELGVDGLRIRKAAGGERAEIKVAGSQTAPVYRVVGLLVSGNELILPGGRFSPRDRGPLTEWLKKLRTEGPPSASGSTGKSPFGLSPGDFAAANADLATRVSFTSKDMPLGEFVDKLATAFRNPMLIDPSVRRILDKGEPLGEELTGLTAGTAIAYAIRSEGLGLLPTVTGGKGLRYAVVKPRAGQTTWPVGWPLDDKKPQEVLPKLFEPLPAEIDDIPIIDVLDTVVGERLKAPVLYDHYAMARQGIDLKKINSKFPPSRTWYAKIIDRVLHQAGLKGEWRLDDGGKPLLWVTTMRPVK